MQGPDQNQILHRNSQGNQKAHHPEEEEAPQAPPEAAPAEGAAPTEEGAPPAEGESAGAS